MLLERKRREPLGAGTRRWDLCARHCPVFSSSSYHLLVKIVIPVYRGERLRGCCILV